MAKKNSSTLAVRYQPACGGGRAVANVKRDFPKAAANNTPPSPESKRKGR